MSKKITKKSGYVVDTNVLCVASGKADHHENEFCLQAAIKFLQKIQHDKISVYLDEGGEIFAEYKKKNQPLGYNGKVGDQFLAYLIQNIGNQNLVNLVEVSQDDEEDYLDFPSDLNLKKFHKKDRKFVATAIASKEDPEIANAGDSRSWEDYKTFLEQYVKLKFLCK